MGNPDKLTNEQLLKENEKLISRVAELEESVSKINNIKENLKEREENYRALYDNAPLSHQSLNADGSFKDVNPTWLNTLGYNREEVIGKFFKDFLHPDWKVKFEKNFPEFKKRGYVHDIHFKVRHKSGHYIDISFEGCVGYNPDGSFKQTYCVFKDISQRQNAEDELKASKEYLERLTNSISDAIFSVKMPDRVIEWANDSYNIFGYEQGEFEGREVTFLHVDQKSSDEFGQKINEALKAGKSVMQTKYPLKRKNGEIFPADVTVTFIEENGSIVNITSIIKDITELKHVEEMLFNEKQILANIIEGTNAGTWNWNVQSGEVIFNERWAGIMGYTLKELEPIGVHTWNDNVHPDDLPNADALLEKHFKGELDYFDVIIRQPHKNGYWVWVNVRGKVIEWTDGGKPLWMYGTHIDITGSKLTEIALAEKEAFNFAIFHNNPIATIIVDNEGKVISSNLKQMSGNRHPNKGDVMYMDYANHHKIDMYTEMINIIKSGNQKTFEELRYKDKYLTISIAPFEHGAIITCQDISDRKNTEDKLLKEKEYSEELINALPGLFLSNKTLMGNLLTGIKISKLFPGIQKVK